MISKSNTLLFAGVGSILTLAFFACSASKVPPSKNASKFLVADLETEAVVSTEDAADDPAIWIDANSPESSLIIGTNKNRTEGGLELYNLNGEKLGGVSDPGLNNADVKQGVKDLQGQSHDIVAASRRTDGSIAIYQMDGQNKTLTNIEFEPRVLVGDVYGFCLYYEEAQNDLRAFIPTKSGKLKQYKLEWQENGKLKPVKMKTLKFETQLEGCVADESYQTLFVGEEDRGLWKVDLNQANEGEKDFTPQLIDAVGTGKLVADVEGLAIAKRSDGSGFLFASSQGENAYAVYNREAPHTHLFSFQLVDGQNAGEVDGTYDTDGIDVYLGNLGKQFPEGIFIAQDGHNTDKDSVGVELTKNQNFKVIGLDKILKP